MIEEKNAFITEDGRVFVAHDLLAYSDYSGSTVERANIEWLEKHFDEEMESPCWKCYYPENIDEPDPDTLILKRHYDYSGIGLFVLDLEKSNEKWHTERAKELEEVVNALADDPLIDDESLFRLESELTEGYLADGILSAWRSPSRLPFLSEEEAISWENLPSGKQKEFVETMLDLFPRYHEPSGENVVIFETGCVPYCRHFDVLLEKAYEAMIEQDCQKWREAGKERGLAFAKHNTTREEAYEAEENDRQYSPFEFTACELNRLPWSDEAWTAYDEGIAEGISSLPEETTDDR